MIDDRERGFLLLDVIIVTAIVAITVIASATFFLGNLTPAVATATIGVGAAIDETRAAATASDSATIVFSTGFDGRGFTARVYDGTPGGVLFRSRTGPLHESATVAVSEIAAPLGDPGFAFGIDRRGNVTGYKNFNASDTAFTRVACPASNAFRIAVADRRETRTVSVPCAAAANSAVAQSIATAPPARAGSPQPAGTCPATSPCTPMPIVPGSATCPAGYAGDTISRGLCDPIASATCPPGSTGTPPVCIIATNPTPTPAPTATATPALLPLYPVAVSGCGIVHTSDVESVSIIHDREDGTQFVTYADATGSTSTQVCGARVP